MIKAFPLMLGLFIFQNISIAADQDDHHYIEIDLERQSMNDLNERSSSDNLARRWRIALGLAFTTLAVHFLGDSAPEPINPELSLGFMDPVHLNIDTTDSFEPGIFPWLPVCDSVIEFESPWRDSCSSLPFSVNVSE